MTKENELPREEMLANLVPNFLYGLSEQEEVVFPKLTAFFKQAYQDLSQYDDFDEKSYREEWIEMLMHLESLAISFQGISTDEVNKAFKDVIGTLEEAKRSRNNK
jgi:hypothetical protein